MKRTPKKEEGSPKLHRSREETLLAEIEALLETVRVLEQSRDHYAELYDGAPLPYLTIDRRGLVESVNLGAAALLGCERRTIRGTPVKRFVHREDQSAFMSHLIRCRQGQPSVVELRLVPTRGEGLLVQLWSRPVQRTGELYATVVVDLRERGGAEAEARQLRQMADDAAKSSAAKNLFIATLSHELRTPLTPILASASALLARDQLPAGVRGLLKLIERSAESEARLIDDLLDLTRITQGKMALNPEPVNVHRAAKEAVEMLRPNLRIKQQRLKWELEAAHHHTQGDPLRLRQIFWNLIANASKFSPVGGDIGVRSWNNGDRLVIEVSDQGAGISEADISRLFVPFEQGANTGGGLGLGLAICKGIVELHGGRILASSAGLGRGARFAVEISTLSRVPETTRTERRRPKQVSERPAILLVDDHVETATALSQLLTEAGYSVRQANSLEGALALPLEEGSILISDIGLGDGSGLDLVRSLRERRAIRGAIAFSGYGTESDVCASKSAGFNIHITKPASFEALTDAIAIVCSDEDEGPTSRGKSDSPRP